jgi:hypothetical protein
MTTIQTEGELIRKAVTWISNEVQAHPEKNRRVLMEQAAVKFNLSPKDVEYLQKLVMSEEK